MFENLRKDNDKARWGVCVGPGYLFSPGILSLGDREEAWHSYIIMVFYTVLNGKSK